MAQAAFLQTWRWHAGNSIAAARRSDKMHELGLYAVEVLLFLRPSAHQRRFDPNWLLLTSLPPSKMHARGSPSWHQPFLKLCTWHRRINFLLCNSQMQIGSPRRQVDSPARAARVPKMAHGSTPAPVTPSGDHFVSRLEYQARRSSGMHTMPIGVDCGLCEVPNAAAFRLAAPAPFRLPIARQPSQTGSRLRATEMASRCPQDGAATHIDDACKTLSFASPPPKLFLGGEWLGSASQPAAPSPDHAADDAGYAILPRKCVSDVRTRIHHSWVAIQHDPLSVADRYFAERPNVQQYQALIRRIEDVRHTFSSRSAALSRC